MSFEVVWTDRALNKLRSVMRVISEDRPQAARRLVNRLFDRAEELGDFPSLGRPYEALPGAGLRQLVEPPYGLIYVVDEDADRVVILAVRHGREPALEPDDLK